MGTFQASSQLPRAAIFMLDNPNPGDVHCLTSDDNTMCGSSLINSSQKYIAKAANLGPTDEVEYDGVTYKICMAELMT
jgi:hypothetical protein